MEKTAAVTVCLLWLLLLLAVPTPASSPPTFLVSNAEATENSWTSKAPMQEARAGLGVAVVNGKIYAIGGDNGYITGSVVPPYSDEIVSTNEEYDPATDTWTIKASMPTPRANFGIAVYQNKIYCIGGRTITPSSNTGVNEVYDPATNTWETKTSMPTARWLLQANVVNGKIYLTGGITVSGSSNVTEVYDPSTDSWTTKTQSPYQITSHASAVVDNNIYFIGTRTAPDPSNPVWTVRTGALVQIYDPAADRWIIRENAPTYGESAAAGVTSGVNAPKRIYFFDETGTHVYDPANDSWTVGTRMPTARGWVGVAATNDTFYVVGGRLPPFGVIVISGPSAANEQYTPFGYGTVPPEISVVSPENKTYTVNHVSLAVTVNKPASWMGYSLDSQANITVTGNTTLTGLSDGSHSLTVYANDTYGNTGASETIYFSIKTFPTTWIVIAIAIIAVVGATLLIYFKKVKKTTGKAE